jgi:electron transfer flavoprotein alpha/beta subunit
VKRWAGVSLSDEAALEYALQLADADEDVVAVTAGEPVATAGLRRARAAGADRAVLVELAAGAPASSGVTIVLDPPAAAARIARTLAEWGYGP